MQSSVISDPVPHRVTQAPIQVLHTRIVSGKGGGPEKTILSSASFLKHTNYDMTAAYLYPDGDDGFETISLRAAQLGCPLFGIPEQGALAPRSLFQLWKFCRQRKVQIWHAHDYKTNLFGLLLCPVLPKMKLITTVHGWVVHTNRTPLYYRIDKMCLPRYHRVLCVSDDLYQTCQSIGVRGKRLELLHNAIDVGFFKRQNAPEESLLRHKIGTPANRLLIGAMGRLMPEKSFDLLIESVDRLIQQGHDVGLWIAGEGPERSELTKLIREKGYSDRIHLVGFVDDIRTFYESLDVFALSSQREGLPNVVLEAAAMRVPIVSTRVAGIPKMLTDGKDALLCPVGDCNSLSTSLGKLVSSSPLRASISSSARKLVETKYSFRRRMDRMATIYDQLLSG